MLRQVEHAHNDIPGIRYEHHGYHGLKHPLEENPGVYVMERVFIYHNLNELVTHNKGQDDARNRENDGFRKALYHTEYAAIPAGRRHTNFPGDFTYFGIHRIEHAG
jgi:hypothetical protein